MTIVEGTMSDGICSSDELAQNLRVGSQFWQLTKVAGQEDEDSGPNIVTNLEGDGRDKTLTFTRRDGTETSKKAGELFVTMARINR